MKTIDEVFEIKNYRVKFYREMHRQMEESLRMFNGDFHVLQPDLRNKNKLHEVLTTISRTMVEEVSAHIRPSSVSIHFEPLGKSDKSKQQADKLEELSYALLNRWAFTKALSPLSEAGKNVCIYGLSGLRTLYDREAWGNPPEKGAGESKEDFEYREALWEAERSTTLPLVISAIDPLNMLPPVGETTPTDMIEFYKVQPSVLMAEFPDYKNADPYKGEVDFTTYFDKDSWLYIAGNEKTRTENLRDPTNPYGLVPYTLVWSGLGKNSPYGKPEQRAVGLIYPVINQIKEKSRALTSVSIILQVSAIGRWRLRNAPAGGLKVGLAPGDVTELETDTELEPWPLLPVSPDLYNMVLYMDQEIERMWGAKLLSGDRPAGVTSAIFEEILLERGEKLYRTLINSMESAYADVLAQSLFLLENVVKQKIPGIHIRPEEIRGYYRPEVTFKYEDIAKKRLRSIIASMLKARGLIDFETAHGKDYLDSANISAIRRGLIKDRLFEDPALIQMLAREIAKEMGIEEQMEQAEGRQEGEVEGGPMREASAGEKREFQELLTPVQMTPKTPGHAGGGFGYSEGEELGFGE